MRIRITQDTAAGLLFFAVGVAAYWIGADYKMGTSRVPGSGVLPRILAWCLMGTGVVIWIQAAFREGPPLTHWAWRPLVMVTLSIIAFALLIDRLGLVATMIVSMGLTALGTPETRWRGEFLVFSAIMIVLGVGLFILLLGMPIKVWPWS
jgi:putative tricarboxylic transport membrane protein